MKTPETLDKLPGEGSYQVVTRSRVREECSTCGEPAHVKHTFLLENFRTNPASSAYRKDDCTWSEDLAVFACREHAELTRIPPPGYDRASSTFFATERMAHLFLRWIETRHPERAHLSDCALHNGPALPVGPCDCADRKAAPC